MTFIEAMREIESHNLAARLNVASDLKTFLRAAREQKVVGTLLQELDSPEKRQQLLLRIIELSRQKVDPRYENQWDTALTLYIWLINLKDLELAKIAAEVTLQARQCWWAKKISFSILLREQIYTNSGLQQNVLQSSLLTTQTTNSEDAILLPSDYLSDVAGRAKIELHNMEYRYDSVASDSTKKEGLKPVVSLDLFHNEKSIEYLNKTDAVTL